MEEALNMLRRNIPEDEDDVDIWTEGICVKPNSAKELLYHLRQSQMIFQYAIEAHYWVNEGDRHSAGGIPFLEEIVSVKAFKNAYRQAKQRIEEWRAAWNIVHMEFWMDTTTHRGFSEAETATLHWGPQNMDFHEFLRIDWRFHINRSIIERRIESVEENMRTQYRHWVQSDWSGSIIGGVDYIGGDGNE